MGLVQEVPGLEALVRVVLVQKAVPGQLRLAQEKGKAPRTLGVVGEEWKMTVAMALASMLNLQLQHHGTFHHSQNSIPHHRQKLVVEMVLHSMTLASIIAEGVQLALWCLVSPALRYKLATLLQDQPPTQ